MPIPQVASGEANNAERIRKLDAGDHAQQGGASGTPQGPYGDHLAGLDLEAHIV